MEHVNKFCFSPLKKMKRNMSFMKNIQYEVNICGESCFLGVLTVTSIDGGVLFKEMFECDFSRRNILNRALPLFSRASNVCFRQSAFILTVRIYFHIATMYSAILF